MPEDPRRVRDMGEREAPWLSLEHHRRRDLEPLGENQYVEMSPPCARIRDEHMHHQVLGPLFHVVVLEREGERSEAESSRGIPERMGLETRRPIEAQAGLIVLRGTESTKSANFGKKLSSLEEVHA